MRSIDIQNPDDLLQKWLVRSLVNIQTHYRASNRYTGYHYWVGVPLICATIVLGSGVIGVFTENLDIARAGRILVGFIATLLASFQVLFRFEERRSQHLVAAQRYGEIMRRIELLRSGVRPTTHEELLAVEQMLNTTVRESPVPPNKIFQEENAKARATYGPTLEIPD